MKHLHITLAVISISFFTLRFFWIFIASKQLNKKWVKVAPHMVDTLLFAVGIGMVFKLALDPFEQLWLGEKLIAIAAYIFTGYYTLKVARNRAMQIFGYLGTVGWFILVARLAMTKENIFL